MRLTPTEQQALRAIREWQAEPPGPATRWFAKASGPASRLVQRALPTYVLRGALDAAQHAAGRADGQDALLRRAGVETVEAMQCVSLEHCNALSVHVRRRAMLLGGAGGAVFGTGGKAGLVLDVPALLLLALRTIQRVGICYGERCLQRADDRVVIAIFAAASANSVAEKTQAVQALRASEQLDGLDPTSAAWRDGVERAAERELAKEAATYSLNNLARTLSLHLGWRKAASVAPIVGALIGGSVNAWYVHDVGRVAQLCFQERWLLRRHPRLATHRAEIVQLRAG